ncbi:MAG TPA: hypothetical protein VGF94_18650 [Kofleriaceae bacterium]|jgi:hypothetical protein
MRGPQTICLLLVAALAAAASACTSTDCGDGTIERDGTCQPADVTTGTAMCGSGTMLEGNVCVPTIMCDPSTTMPVVDSMGNTICVGISGGGCSACPAPSRTDGSLQTVCGQIYDFATNQPFVATGATGSKCTTGATTGPCAIAIQAYDAIAFATDPMTATPLTVGSACIDDMGRFAIADIASPSGPEIGLGIDDIAGANMGPPGVTNAVGIALAKSGTGMAITGIEDWIVTEATTTSWQTTGGPSIAGGIFAPVYRAHCIDPGCTGDPLANQAGATITKSGNPVPSSDYYFAAADTMRTTIDGSATATGVNGTGLFTGASVGDGPVYGGTGGITDTVNCQWGQLNAASIPGIVTVQVMRKTHTFGKTCTE